MEKKTDILEAQVRESLADDLWCREDHSTVLSIACRYARDLGLDFDTARGVADKVFADQES